MDWIADQLSFCLNALAVIVVIGSIAGWFRRRRTGLPPATRDLL